MTLAYLSIVLLLVLFIIPYGMGCILIKSKELCLTWMGGFFVSLCAFEVLALIFHAIYGSLHVMVILWCMSCGTSEADGTETHGRGFDKIDCGYV